MFMLVKVALPALGTVYMHTAVIRGPAWNTIAGGRYNF